MANYPTLPTQNAESPDVFQGGGAAAAGAGALSTLGAESDQLGRTLTDMANIAAKQEGEGAAAADVAAGAIHPRLDGTVRGEAYDSIAKNYLGANLKAALHQQLADAYEANPDNPQQLGPALDATYKGVTANPTPYPDLNVELGGHFAIQRADYMARAAAGARAALVANGKSAFLQDLQNNADLMDQVAAGASSDAAGGQRITDAGTAMIQSLAKYGPKEAYDVAGVHFDADPSRAAAMKPDDMTRVALGEINQARKTWILATAHQLSDEGSRKMFAAQVMDKWKAGDPSFAGLDGKDMDELQRQLEASADRARADDRAAKSEAAEQARGAIQAFTWGGNPDFDAAAVAAKNSGDAGLQAQVEFYRTADEHTRGVLRSVVARQLGLIGQSGPGTEWVDANGQPADVGAPGGAPRGVRNNNPGNVKALPNGASWVGQTGVDPAGFAVFATPQAGAHAAKSVLRGYGTQGLDTPLAIASKYAPKGDGNNDPVAYAAHVAAALHVGPNDHLDMSNPAVIDHLASAMFNVETPGTGAWATPPTVAPGTLKFAAWASTQQGFSTDPLNFARGGATRPAIANVPPLVPQGAYSQGPDNQAWAQALQKRQALGQGLSQTYGVPARMLDDGEVAYYKSQISADPMKGIALVRAAQTAVGADGASALMHELGQTGPEINVNLHIARLQAAGAGNVALSAVHGLQLQAEGRKLNPQDEQSLNLAFDGLRGAVQPDVLAAARATAQAAWVSDQAAGSHGTPDVYAAAALGGVNWKGVRYGGPAKVNGAQTVLPPWLSPDRAPDALRALGGVWLRHNNGPVWANGDAVQPDQVAGMQLSLQPTGRYTLVNPKTGGALRQAGGGAFTFDPDPARDYLGQVLGSAAVRPSVLR